MENLSQEERLKKEFEEFEEYAESFTEAEWEYANSIADLAHRLCRDLTDEAEIRFVRAAMERKRADPNPDPPAIGLLNAGLVAIGKPPIVSQKRGRRKSQLSGAGI